MDVLANALGSLDGKIRTTDVWTILEIEPRNRNQAHNEAMGAAMRELGWERQKRRFDGIVLNAYVKGDGAQPIYVFRDPVSRTVSVDRSPEVEGDRSKAYKDVPF